MLSGAGILGRRDQIVLTLSRWRQVAPRQHRGGAGLRNWELSTYRVQSVTPRTARRARGPRRQCPSRLRVTQSGDAVLLAELILGWVSASAKHVGSGHSWYVARGL